jgi:succinate dehydrogenase / fumarate reductase membrane anchor subunit
MRSRYPDQGSALEYYLWMFTRLSGVLMLLMGAFGIVYANLAGGRTLMDMATQYRWAFFPTYWHVQNSDIPDVFPNWSNSFWQIYAIILFFVAAVHGFNGLRIVVEDYIHRPYLLLFAKGLVFVLFLFTLLAAVVIVFELFV